MLELIINQYKNVSSWQIVIEIVVFIFGIISVYFAKKQNILFYPTGLIATVLTVYLMYQAKYFADMNINIYYSIMSVYGWVYWRKTEQKTPLRITYTNEIEKFICLGLFLFSSLFCFGVYTFFDVQFQLNNYLDTLSSGIFFTAMWLMARKKIENWPLWILGNIIVIYLFFDRHLYIISLQYFIFTILAFSAYFSWKKHLQPQIFNK